MIESEDVPEVAVMIDGPMYDMVFPSNWKIHQSSNHLEMQRALNLLFKFYPNEPWYGLLTDHSRPETKSWSRIIESHITPRGVVLVNDTKNRMNPVTGLRRITSASVYGGDLIRDLGWVWLNTVTHMYGDDALEMIGHSLGIRYLDQVIVKDLLVREGEIPVDQNHRRLYKGRPYIESDRQAYNEWLKDFPSLIESLRKRETDRSTEVPFSSVAR